MHDASAPLHHEVRVAIAEAVHVEHTLVVEQDGVAQRPGGVAPWGASYLATVVRVGRPKGGVLPDDQERFEVVALVVLVNLVRPPGERVASRSPPGEHKEPRRSLLTEVV